MVVPEKRAGVEQYFKEFSIFDKQNALDVRQGGAMRANGIEFRRGSAGGGNQLRQPYLKGIVPAGAYRQYPEVEHIHFFGYYIGNYPSLSTERVEELCRVLNAVE